MTDTERPYSDYILVNLEHPCLEIDVRRICPGGETPDVHERRIEEVGKQGYVTLTQLRTANARAEAAEADRAALVDAIDRLLIAVYDLDGFKKCPEVIDHAEAVMRPHDLSGLVGELREKRGFNAPQEQGDE